MMQRIPILMLLSFVALGGNFAAAQDDEKPIQKLFKPIKEFRTRHCNPNPVKGCMCAKCKAKRQKKLCERCVEKAKEAAEKEKEKQQLIMDLEKLALELKKLADERKKFEEQQEKEAQWDFLDEEEAKNELLKMAAAAKADQDLEPKKIQALQYIASLGCSKVPDAPKIILEGLKDPNVNVRAAAVQAILSPYLMPYEYGEYYPGAGYADANGAVQYQVSSCGGGTCSTGCCPPSKKRSTRREKKACDFCKHQSSIDAVIAQLTPECKEKPKCCNPCEECQGRRSKRRTKKIKCGFCRGRGCQNCNNQGHVNQVCEVPCDCQLEPPTMPDLNRCKTTDACQACCTKEIQDELKKMAFEVKKNGCFYEPNEIVRGLAVQALEMCPGLPKEKEDPIEADPIEADPTEQTPSEALNGDEDELDLGEGNDDSSTYYRDSDNRFARPVSSRRNYDNESAGPITHTIGYVGSINSDNSIIIQLDGDFMIPTNYVVEIETSNGRRYEAIVTASSVGKITVKSTGVPFRVTQGEELRFGVVAANPNGI